MKRKFYFRPTYLPLNLYFKKKGQIAVSTSSLTESEILDIINFDNSDLVDVKIIKCDYKIMTYKHVYMTYNICYSAILKIKSHKIIFKKKFFYFKKSNKNA